ncbi:MAG: RepB family plasmid replication initiator protein, partial [Enterococcus sp.]
MKMITNNDQNSKERTVCSLKEIEKRKIVEHNDLITSVAKMDKVPLKIFELAVSCIDTDNPPKNNTIYLSKDELFKFFDVSDNGKHSRFKLAVEKMQKQAYFEVREQTGKGFEFESIVPIPYIKWNNYDDKVTIRFDIAIMPYLIELKQNFTQYALSDVMELNSKYSIIIYKWLCMNYNQYEHYRNSGGRRSRQIESYRTPSISIEELRTLTDTVNEYSRFQSLENRVLKQAIKEINDYTHFTVSYEKIKKGRSIDSIQFNITKKYVAKDEFYKQEQQDPVYLQDKENKEQRERALFVEAMQSKYTTILMENMLIGYKDMQDIKIMAELQQVVYPLYDE